MSKKRQKKIIVRFTAPKISDDLNWVGSEKPIPKDCITEEGITNKKFYLVVTKNEFKDEELTEIIKEDLFKFLSETTVAKLKVGPNKNPFLSNDKPLTNYLFEVHKDVDGNGIEEYSVKNMPISDYDFQGHLIGVDGRPISVMLNFGPRVDLE